MMYLLNTQIIISRLKKFKQLIIKSFLKLVIYRLI